MKDPGHYITEQCPTVQDVVNLAMNPRWPFGVAIVPQARICDMDRNPVSLPVPLNPNDPSALCSIDGGGWVKDIDPEMNASDDVHRKTTFRLYEFPGIEAFNTLKNLIRISVQYFRLDGPQPVLMNEVSVGYFLFTIPDRTLLDSGNYWDITGHGLTQIIADLGFENDYTIPAGANIVDAARAMLMADKLPPQEGGRLPLNSCGAGGNCYGCPEPSGTGTGQGYCQVGYAITDPLSSTLPYGSSTTLRQRGADGFTGPVLYNATIGMKIDATTGAPIDPWTCQPMSVEIVSPGTIGSMVPGEMVPGEMVAGASGGTVGAFPAFILSKPDTAGNQMYIDTSTGKCYDALLGNEVDPTNGHVAVITTPLIFKKKLTSAAGTGGGDGGPSVAQGNGKGYSPSFGWAVNDTAHALTMQTAPGAQFYLHFVSEAGHNLVYWYTALTTGMKIDAVTGHVIDPWNNQQMPYNTLASGGPDPAWAGDLFVAFEPFGGLTMYFNPEDAHFYTWDGVQSAGHLTEVDPPWNGVTPTYPETVFQLAGGDGGTSTLPPGAIGPQAGPIGNYVWPDPMNPGLTPSCCPHSGPNIPGFRIIAVPSDQLVIDPDSGKHIRGDPKTRDTLPFTPKDNQLKSFNNLLDVANYWKVFDDSDGNFVLAPLPYLDGVTPSPDPNFSYVTGEQGVIFPGIQQKLLDATAIANKVVVRSENAKRAAITAVAYNRSNYSYLSVQNLGRIIQKQPVIQLDTITDQRILQLRADVEINFAAMPGESIQMEVMLNPFLEVHDVIGLNVWSPDGKTLEISSQNNPFLVTSWKHNFNTRRTTLVLGRLVPL